MPLLNGCPHNSNAIIYLFEEQVLTSPSPFCEPEPLSGSNPTLVAMAYLSIEELYSTRQDRSQGLRSDARLFTGRCVSPTLLPEAFRHDHRYELEFRYSSQTLAERVPCYLRKLPTSRLGLERRFGEYIELEVLLK